jgi:hypothetical protein
MNDHDLLVQVVESNVALAKALELIGKWMVATTARMDALAFIQRAAAKNTFDSNI